jgi:hypothetical protein
MEDVIGDAQAVFCFPGDDVQPTGRLNHALETHCGCHTEHDTQASSQALAFGQPIQRRSLLKISALDDPRLANIVTIKKT